jgi:predicted dehydrogenase
MVEVAGVAREARRIRVGLVGAGNWAFHGHLRVLDLLPDYEVVAVYARRREAAGKAAQRYGIQHIAESIADLVALPDVDVVIVLTTAPQHEEAVRAAIAAGKHVYCEWPLTISTPRAEKIERLVRDAGIRHVVGLQRRLAPHNRYVRDLLAQGYVGRVRSVRMHVSMNYFQAVLPNALRWTVPAENFSTVVAIYAGHFLDMLFHSVGRPRSLSALMVNQFPKATIRETGEVFDKTTPDQLVLVGTLENGAVLSVHIEGGKRNGSGVQIDITGDEGDIRIGDNIPLQTLDIPAEYNWLPASDLPSAVLELANLYVAFARDLAAGTQTAPTFDDAVWMHRLIELFETSSRMGARVAVT